MLMKLSLTVRNNMNCPSCNKHIVISKSAIREEDGGVLFEVQCSSCDAEFEAFISPQDLTRVYDNI